MLTFSFVTTRQQQRFALYCHWCHWSVTGVGTHTDSFVRTCLHLLLEKNNNPKINFSHRQLQSVLLCHRCQSDVSAAITHSERWSLSSSLFCCCCWCCRWYKLRQKVKDYRGWSLYNSNFSSSASVVLVLSFVSLLKKQHMFLSSYIVSFPGIIRTNTSGNPLLRATSCSVSLMSPVYHCCHHSGRCLSAESYVCKDINEYRLK